MTTSGRWPDLAIPMTHPISTAAGGKAVLVTPWPHVLRRPISTTTWLVLAGGLIAYVAVVALSLSFFSVLSTKAVTVLAVARDGEPRILVEDEGSQEQWVVAWEGEVAAGDVVEITLRRSCQCRPRRSERDQGKSLILVALVGPLAALLFGPALVHNRRKRRRMRRSAGALVESAVATEVTLAPQWFGVRPAPPSFVRWRLFYEVHRNHDRTSLGWISMIAPTEGFDPCAPVTMIGDARTGSAVAFVAGHGPQVALPSTPLIDRPQGNVHPLSGLASFLVGWGLASEPAGPAEEPRAPVRPNSAERAGALRQSRRRLLVLCLLFSPAATVAATRILAGGTELSWGRMILASAAMYFIWIGITVALRPWVRQPFVLLVRSRAGHGGSSARLLADTLFGIEHTRPRRPT